MAEKKFNERVNEITNQQWEIERKIADLRAEIRNEIENLVLDKVGEDVEIADADTVYTTLFHDDGEGDCTVGEITSGEITKVMYDSEEGEIRIAFNWFDEYEYSLANLDLYGLESLYNSLAECLEEK